jgi:hypothetical protein
MGHTGFNVYSPHHDGGRAGLVGDEGELTEVIAGAVA